MHKSCITMLHFDCCHSLILLLPVIVLPMIQYQRCLKRWTRHRYLIFDVVVALLDGLDLHHLLFEVNQIFDVIIFEDLPYGVD